MLLYYKKNQKKTTSFRFENIWIQHILTMVTTKSKLQMEFNKEVTSASSGLVYVCFGTFVKWSSRGAHPARAPLKLERLNLFYC
jgi:hypothetical protein